MSNWTKDADGEYVRWNEPPHYINGVLNLLLDDETKITDNEFTKRNREYMKLAKRNFQCATT